MKGITMQGNPVREVSIAKKQVEEAQRERDMLKRQFENASANNEALVNVMKRMKKQGQRKNVLGSGGRRTMASMEGVDLLSKGNEQFKKKKKKRAIGQTQFL